MRKLLLKIRKWRRNKFMPNHENDWIYNFVTNILNRGGNV